MDKQAAALRGRKEFRVVVGTNPVLLVGDTGRWVVTFINEGSADVYIGSPSSNTGTWMYLPSDQGFTDNYTSEAWYARSLTSSGTVSGWFI